MLEPTFDENGYPAATSLAALETWDCADPLGAFLFAAALWNRTYGWFDQTPSIIEPLFEVRADEDSRVWFCMATGGWSGNEDVIGALQRNTVLWLVSWSASVRGGYYEFGFNMEV